MSNAVHPSHALFLEEGEVDTLLTGEADFIVRRHATSLRMPVALLRELDRTIVGTAYLAGVAPVETADETGAPVTRHVWRLEDCQRAEASIRLETTGAGPIWLRLRTAERDLLWSAAKPITTSSGPGPAPDEISTADNEFAYTGGEEAPRSNEAGLTPSTPPEGPAYNGIIVEDEAAEEGPETGPLEEPSLATDTSAAESASDEPGVVPPATDIDRAHWRAMAYVPASMVTIDEASRILIRLRDDEIKPSFPAVQPEYGILRRNMLHALLDGGVASLEDYEELIPEDMRRTTDRRHVEAYLQPILAILAKVK